MFRIVPKNTDIDFVGKAKIVATISLLVVIGSIALYFTKGPSWGIDFVGGTDIILKFEKDVTDVEVRDAALRVFKDAGVQKFGEAGSREYKIQTKEISVVNEQSVDKIKGKLKTLSDVRRILWQAEQPDKMTVVFKDRDIDTDKIKSSVETLGLENVVVTTEGVDESKRYIVRFEGLGSRTKKGFAAVMGPAFNADTGLVRLKTVGPTVGKQLRQAGAYSLIVALFLILIYIAFRFDIRYATGAVAALGHDVAISIGVFILVGTEFNLSIIAALLTIVGYSLNDTIVVFDRIRENFTEEGEEDVPKVVNASINETLSRTLMTSITTLLAVGAIYLWSGDLIQDFAFALIVGVGVGTYSSVFVASPVMLAVDNFLRVRKASRQVISA